MELKDKKVVVVGAGKSGISAARFLLSKGAEVVLNDSANIDHIRPLEEEGITLVGMGHDPELFSDKDLIIMSPGVPVDVSPLLEIILSAKGRGVEVISEIELASRFTDTPVIAVTGTNGKSTTTSLLADMLEKGGKKIFAGGNLGIPFTEYLIEGDNADLIVLELSSFQLEGISNFRPFISIMLNISPDHLDRYNSMDDYIDAKKRIFLNQGVNDYALLNMEDDLVSKLSSEISSKLIPFGSVLRHKGGVYADGGFVISEIDGHEIKIAIAGNESVYIMENVIAAFAAATICGIKEDVIVNALRKFKGLPHRMEYVAEVGGVSFYDDSKATNVGAVVKSLEGIDGKVVLIAGGKDKGGGYEPLRRIINKKVTGVVLIGEAAEKIEKAIGDEVVTVLAFSLEDAVEKAWHFASAGDSVLLSPACSSFDMFASYSERGEVFKNAVRVFSSKTGINEKEVRFAS